LQALAKELSAEDDLAAIIRCHLYIEHEINMYLEAKVPAPDFEIVHF